MIRVADYITKTLADYGVHHIFMITGGGAMYLNNAIAKEPRLKYICNHHEQACAMAAEAYARVTGSIGVINVTTGPGGINTLNGVFGAWTDSIPMLVISGQVKRETCMATYRIPGLRQLGDQEADIIGMVRGITKYATLVDDPKSIRYHLGKAWYLAASGRPGPCWLDIPIDVQASMIDDEALLRTYNPDEDALNWDEKLVTTQCTEILHRITEAHRPVILAGTGVRQAQALEVFYSVIHKLQIPVTTAWTHDLIASDNPLFCGRPGTIGTRAGNFTVQNADLLLVIGSRLNIRQISYNWQSFARCAFKIQVDVDPTEFEKPTVKIDMAVHCDAKVFLEELDRQIDTGIQNSHHTDWLKWCRERLAKYPNILTHQRSLEHGVNPYFFVETLFERLAENDVIVCANATATIVPFQAAHLKKGQRMFSNSGSASMGYDLPAAIGAAVGSGKRVICLAGDGSIQMNIQELQTIVTHHLPVKIFVLNNNGYLSIRISQSNFFGETVGESPTSGVCFPDMVTLAQAYGLSAFRTKGQDLVPVLDTVLSTPGPVLCEIMLDPNQQFEPRISSKQLPDGRIVSARLEDMFPFLDSRELQENLLIPPVDS